MSPTITFPVPPCSRADCDHGWDCEPSTPRRRDVAVRVGPARELPYRIVAHPGRIEARTLTADGEDGLLAFAAWEGTRWAVSQATATGDRVGTVVRVGAEPLARAQLETYAEQALEASGGAR